MNNNKLKLNALYSGAGIIVTYKCSAACLHCCYSSSPERSGEYMTKQTADKIFALLKKMGCNSVHIGGGEPFMNFDKLLEVCKSALEHNISVDYIETNASWYIDTDDDNSDDDVISEKSRKLIETGINCLLISVDPFHNEFVPYIKIKNLVKRCRENNMETFIWQSGFERIVKQLDENKTHTLLEYENLYGKDFIKTIAQSYGLNYNGRALRILEKTSKNKKSCEDILKESGVSCGEKIKSLSHFHVDLYENLIPPSCNGFNANIFELCGGGLDYNKYINFMSVVNGGLESLFKRADSLGFIPNSDGYTSKCALCFDIKKYISKINPKIKPADIGPWEFFEKS